ncbi:hypothetical protein LKF24_1677 [Lactococcus lactis subsp. lactis]|nr:hypothetical protein LKF24_1677 [Lactococcus lactis subsp. lactis]
MFKISSVIFTKKVPERVRVQGLLLLFLLFHNLFVFYQ